MSHSAPQKDEAGHDEGSWILAALSAQADRARDMVGRACAALIEADSPAAQAVIDDDAVVDAAASELHDRLARSLVGATPTQEQVRLVFAGLHANLHLERIADYAVTIAKMRLLTEAVNGDPLVLDDIRGMGAAVEEILDGAMAALHSRDTEGARRLGELDQTVNRANRLTVSRLLDLGADSTLREWGLRMLLVSRCLERVGDHAVDIGEQVQYLATGEPPEFSSGRDRATQ